jgi:hypothetical protein
VVPDLRESGAADQLQRGGTRRLGNRAVRSPGHRGRDRHRYEYHHEPPHLSETNMSLRHETFFMNL